MFYSTKKSFLLIIALILTITSCTTKKALYWSKNQEDYNKREIIKHPYYKTTLNPLGYLFSGAIIAGGAYAGYKSDLIKINENPSDIAGAIIGAVIGTYLIGWGNHKIWNQGKVYHLAENNYSASKWIKKYSRKYKLIEFENDNLKIINKRIEPKYSVKYFNDVKEFHIAFPNSKYNDKVLNQSINVLPSNQMPQIVNLFPNARGIKNAKRKYITSQTNLKDYFEAIDKYPNIIDNPKKHAVELIKRFDDIRLFVRRYGTLYESNKLIEKAFNLATKCEDGIYLNRTFPNNKYYDNVLIKNLKNCSTHELDLILNQFSDTKNIRKIKIEYLKRSDNIYSFLELNKKFELLNISTKVDNLDNAKKMVGDINKYKSELSFKFTNKLVNEVKNEILSKTYNNFTKSDSQQKEFISLINNNKWLAPSSNDFIEKANHQIYLNNKTIIDRKNEVDDIYNYVSLEDGFIETVDGDDLSLWQSVLSSITDMGNKNAFISGKLVNYGKLPKKVKLTVALNMFEAEKVTFWGINKNKKFKKKNYFFTEMQPGSKQDFVVLIPYRWKYKDESSIWGRNYYEVNIEQSDPVNLELHYFDDEISNETLMKQNRIISAYRQNGNVSRKKGFESSYNVSSHSYRILSKSSSTSAVVTELTSHSTQSGCISIYSENDEDYGYYSEITSNYGTKLADFSDANKDNVAGCFSKRDFPLTVSVSYHSKHGNNISAVIKLIDFKDYTVRVTD